MFFCFILYYFIILLLYKQDNQQTLSVQIEKTHMYCDCSEVGIVDA